MTPSMSIKNPRAIICLFFQRTDCDSVHRKQLGPTAHTIPHIEPRIPRHDFQPVFRWISRLIFAGRFQDLMNRSGVFDTEREYWPREVQPACRWTGGDHPKTQNVSSNLRESGCLRVSGE